MNTINVNSLEIFRMPSFHRCDELNSMVNDHAYMSIVVTNKCQCKCPYCINSETDHTLSLPVEKALSNIDKLANIQTGMEVILLGGEPTLHPHLFELVEGLRKNEKLSTIRITTNGIRLKDKDFLYKLIDKENGVQGINISFHNEEFISFKELEEIYKFIKEHNPDIKIRINTNVWRNNHDNVHDLYGFIMSLTNYCDEIRVSNLIPKDEFSVNSVNKGEHMILPTEEYQKIFTELTTYGDFENCALFENPETLGFVRYLLISYKKPIIINWNFNSTVAEQTCENNRHINTFKCLVNGEISLSWNTHNIIKL